MTEISGKNPEREPFDDENSSISDRFNDIFSRLGWIYYKSFDLNIASNAIIKAESNDFNGAEEDLIKYYDKDRIKYNLQELGELKTFRLRLPLAQKALIDYEEGRYHSSVPVVLALLDGMITEAYLNAGGDRLNASAEDINVNAWNSIANHSKALKSQVGILKKGRYKTVIEQIDKPYRHGILHGMDLGYDNKTVAAKAWAALFAIRDWVEKAETGLLDIQFDANTNNKILESERAKSPPIQDIPSIKKFKENITILKTIKGAMSFFGPFLGWLGVDTNRIKETLLKIEFLEESEAMPFIPDRFNDLFAERGWIIYELMNLEVAKTAIKKAESGDIDGAEIDLVNYYDEKNIRFNINRMKDVKAFRPRWNLAHKALIDYLEGRHHACVPVVLALLEGIVNEAHGKGRGSKLGFSAKDVNLEAWDSISGHAKGLKAIASVFNEDRGKTNVDQITIPYRNGILHGMDLCYDNRIVAAKAWAALFSVRCWAMKAEQGSLNPKPPEDPISWKQVIKQINENKLDELKLLEWKPRVIKIGQDTPATGGPEEYDAGTPERKLAEFLSLWKKTKPNFRAMADCIVLDSNDRAKEMPRRIEHIYSAKHLSQFKFNEISDIAPATTIVRATLAYEENGAQVIKSVQFIMNKRNQIAGPETMSEAGENWYIRFWEIV
jgi:hypothetical protein